MGRMQPATLLMLLAWPALGNAIVPRALQGDAPLDGPVWADTYDTDNRISSDSGRQGAVVFNAGAAAERERGIEEVLEQPVESLLDEQVVAQLRALAEPRLQAVLRAPARLLVRDPADVRAAMRRPVYETLSARAKHLLDRLPAHVHAAVAALLRLPLRDVLRPDPDLEPLLRSFINTPDRPVTCPPGLLVARDGTCRDKWK